MTTHISILCPTRKRVVKLERMIRSIHTTALNKDSYEIILRCHSDDPETIAALPALLQLGNVRAYIGEPLHWGKNLFAFSQCARLAEGSWAWWMNDDCVVYGSGWDMQMREVPDSHIAIPEVHRLGLSTYHRDRGLPMQLYPMDSWGPTRDFPLGGDAGLWEHYRSKGYGVHWLSGITVWHDRSEPDCDRINDIK